MIKVKKERKKRNVNGKGLYDKAVNFLIRPTEKLRSGEMHVPMWNKEKNRLDVARFSGPGTSILEKVKSGVKPLGIADAIALRHDLAYSLDSSINSQGIKHADDEMVKSLKKARELGKDSAFNTIPSQLGIQANQLLAKVLPNKAFDWFVQKMTGQKEFRQNLKPEDRLLLQEKFKEIDKELKQEGVGKKKRKPYKKRVLKK